MLQVIHIAGNDVEVNAHLRQRCLWCGALIIDQNLHHMLVASTKPEDRRPAIFPPGSLVAIDDQMKFTVAYTPGDPLPEGCCATLDPEVTI